jgi:hypothetical protein
MRAELTYYTKTEEMKKIQREPSIRRLPSLREVREAKETRKKNEEAWILEVGESENYKIIQLVHAGFYSMLRATGECRESCYFKIIIVLFSGLIARRG